MTARSFTLDKPNALLLGVCSGIADYFGWNAIYVRIAAVLLTLTGVFSFLPLVYILVAWLAPATA